MTTSTRFSRRLYPAILIATYTWGIVVAAQGGQFEHIAFQTIQRRDVGLLESLLQQDMPVDLRSIDGTTLLMYAALYGDAEAVGLLLKFGADPNAANQHGVTPLIWGAGDIRKVRLLLEAGASPHATSTLGNTSLIVAAAFPQAHQTLSLLIDSGADVNARNQSGLTAIMRTAQRGNLEGLKLLVEHGADLNDKMSGSLIVNHRTLLAEAAANGHADIVKYLVEQGADVNIPEGTMVGHPLNLALARQRPDIADYLITHGADINYRSEIGLTPPIVWSAYLEYDDHSIARRLLAAGADPGATTGRGESALDWASGRQHHGLLQFLRGAGVRAGMAHVKHKEIPDRGIRLETATQNELIRGSVTRSLSLMLKSSDTFFRNRSNCVSCHHQDLPLVAAAWARRRGISMPEVSVAAIIRTRIEDWASIQDSLDQMDQPRPVPERMFGFGLFGLAEQGYSADDAVHSVVRYLANIQYADGHWDSGFLRPPLGDRDFMPTALVLRALRMYPLLGHEDEYQASVARAARWLKKARPRTLNEHAFRLLGLAWAGSETAVLQEAISEMLDMQREDGGWSQLPNLSSDAWATGLTLVALHTAGLDKSDAAYRRGVEFLLSTQFDDGSWYVPSRSWPFQPHFDSRFPHGRDQWISIAGTAWATMALTLTLEPTATSVPSYLTNSTSAPATYTRSRAAPGETDAANDLDVNSHVTKTVDFERDIRPIFEASCLDCHGGDEPEGHFRVVDRDSLMKGGESGVATFQPGNGAESQLIRYLTDQVEDMEMPPLHARETYPRLTHAQLQKLIKWINEGANWNQGVVLGE